MHRYFLDFLSHAEQKLYAMMKEGCYVEQIALELSMDEETVICMIWIRCHIPYNNGMV